MLRTRLSLLLTVVALGAVTAMKEVPFADVKAMKESVVRASLVPLCLFVSGGPAMLHITT